MYDMKSNIMGDSHRKAEAMLKTHPFYFGPLHWVLMIRIMPDLHKKIQA